MTVKEYIDKGLVGLLPLYGKEEAKSLLMMVLEHYARLPAHIYYTDPNRMLPSSCLSDIQKALGDLNRAKPVQYILGKTFFEGCTINVQEGVLIPRPETEELVRWAKSELKERPSKNLYILDACTGSGAIAITLAKAFPQAKVYGIDICEKALGIAKENNALNNTEAHFLKADMLQPPDLPALSWQPHTFDLIISNPPYIGESEKTSMHPNVLNYEPHRALFVPDHDLLLFYRALADWGALLLTDNGLLMVEINEKMSKELRSLLAHKGYSSVQVRKDLHEKPRMCYALKTFSRPQSKA